MGKKVLNGTAPVAQGNFPKKGARKDLWTEIEKGDLKSAHQIFYKAPVEEPPKKKHYEKLKSKIIRRSGGEAAERIDFHQNNKGTKRKHSEDVTLSKKVKGSAAYHLYGNGQMDEKMRNGKSNEARKGKKARKEVHQRVNMSTEETEYVVEEPDDAVAINGEDRHRESKNVRFANLFEDDLDDGHLLLQSFAKNVRGLDVDSDEYEDEEFSEEELFEGLEDEDEIEDEEIEEDEVDEDVMKIHPDDIAQVIEEEEEEAYASPLSSSDEEGIDEEEHENCSSCSDVSDQDAESDEEGNIGENRVATVMKKANKSSPLNFDEFPFSDDDSSVTATRALAWMISNCDVQTFFNDFYQQNCLVVQRKHPDYYGNLFSSQRLGELLENNYIEYGVNINVAEYKNSIRITPNGSGRAYPRQIKSHLKQGRSIQLVNPQTFDDHIWYLCEVLQEVFGCFVGANTYLTPAGSAGFAPHWDEIDAFLLQVEGRKYWKIYAPQSNEDELPRESSGNFTEADMKKRKPTFEGWLEAGDMLYIPRGFIHQARTDKNVHSLHVTVSTGRQWTFADVMEKLLPDAITALADQRWKMRKGLPIGLLDMNGMADYKYRMDEYFIEKYAMPLDRHISMLRNFVSDTCLPSSVDLMAREFMKTALPPLITPAERKFHVIGQSGESLLQGNPIVFHQDIYIRLMRRHGQRLIFETEEKCFIVHRIANSRLYEGREEQTIDLDIKYVPSFTILLDHTPEWTKVGELPGLSDVDRKAFCQLLYDNGIILAKNITSKKNKQFK